MSWGTLAGLWMNIFARSLILWSASSRTWLGRRRCILSWSAIHVKSLPFRTFRHRPSVPRLFLFNHCRHTLSPLYIGWLLLPAGGGGRRFSLAATVRHKSPSRLSSVPLQTLSWMLRYLKRPTLPQLSPISTWVPVASRGHSRGCQHRLPHLVVGPAQWLSTLGTDAPNHHTHIIIHINSVHFPWKSSPRFSKKHLITS